MAPEEAVALVRDGLCHAAVVAGSGGASPIERTSGPLISARLAECEVVLAVAADRGRAPADLLRRGARVVVGPHGTPARRVLEDALRALGAPACELTEVRSDAAALATVAGGYAVCAASAAPPARRAALNAIPLGRARLDLVIHRAVSKRDPALRALLDALRSRTLAAILKQAGYTPGDVAVARAAGGTALTPRVASELKRMRIDSSLEATA
jgi:molybdate-binding protein